MLLTVVQVYRTVVFNVFGQSDVSLIVPNVSPPGQSHSSQGSADEDNR